MNELIELTEKPVAEEIYMLAGWRQWADGGSISSALPQYVIELTNARRIGRIKPYGFYLFQVPGTQYLFRPEIKLEDGYPKELRLHKNDIYYAGDEHKGLVIFLGDEPHLNGERYAETFFSVVKELNVKRVVGVGGVLAPMPYDKDRRISCTYSLRVMKKELSEYAVRFSNYEGGVSIGSYLASFAKQWGIEYVGLYAFVPTYDFSELSSRMQGITVENDFKAWHDIMCRINYMFGLQLNLSELEAQSQKLTRSLDAKFDELARKHPQADVKGYLAKLSEGFEELSFMPLDEVWERELGDIFKGME
jgi:proteasome assembly chaperone (PAC2) family protein